MNFTYIMFMMWQLLEAEKKTIEKYSIAVKANEKKKTDVHKSE